MSNIIKFAFEHLEIVSSNITVSPIKCALQSRVFVVIGNPSELLAEQHPRGCHPWHDDVSRIGEQEFAEFAEAGTRDRTRNMRFR